MFVPYLYFFKLPRNPHKVTWNGLAYRNRYMPLFSRYYRASACNARRTRYFTNSVRPSVRLSFYFPLLCLNDSDPH